MKKMLIGIFLAMLILFCGGCGRNPLGSGELPQVNTNTVFEWQGFNICAWGKDWFSDTTLVDKALKFALDEGANFLALDWPVNFNDDGTRVPFEDSLHPYWEDIQRLIQKARQAGFSIMLKPHTTKAESPENRNIWNTDTAKFLPANFFPAYKGYLEELANFAEQNHVDAICIGTEMNHLDTAYHEEWKELVAAVRGRFTGLVTYDALFNRWFRSVPDVEEVCFWDLVDMIGVSLYVPVTHNDNASVEEIRRGWIESIEQPEFKFEIDDVIAYLKGIAQNAGKPLMALEGGYQSVSGGLYDMTGPSPDKTVNYDLQSRGLDAYLGILDENKDNWFKGVSLWQLTPSMLSSSNLQTIWHTQEFSVYEKPAAKIVKAHFFDSASNLVLKGSQAHPSTHPPLAFFSILALP
jgi:hypothetical protein